MDAMLDEERLRVWPLPPLGILVWLLNVEALERFAGRTLSVRICLWNLVPVAASESTGMSSFTCTV
jgi:hypothetical protein